MKLLSLLSIAFISLIIWREASSEDLFVTPFQTCGSTCTGTLSMPYDSLAYALQKAASFSTGPNSIILLYSNSADHYLLAKEKVGSSVITYFSTTNNDITFDIKVPLEIRPLFCDEDRVLDNQTLLDKCLNRTAKITIFLKTIGFTISVREKLVMQNIILDGIEAFSDYNSDTATVNGQYSACSNARMRCCKVKGLSAQNYSPQMKCTPENSASNSLRNSIIVLNKPTKSSIIQSIYFANFELRNLWGKDLAAFLENRSESPFNITFQNSNMDDLFFIYGTLVSTNTTDPASLIVFKNLNFSNYNYWKRSNSNNVGQGYLIYTAFNIFQTSIQVIESNFNNADPTINFNCRLYTDSKSPLANVNNKLESKPGARSDIWSIVSNQQKQLFQIFTGIQTSSLFHLYTMKGNLTVLNSTFTKIAGAMGSVFYLPNFNGIYNIFTVKNSIFDMNFATQSFPNILVISPSEDYSYKVNCSRIEIDNCQFINSRGCPGVHGNVGYVCYWNPTGKPVASPSDWANGTNTFRDVIKPMFGTNFPSSPNSSTADWINVPLPWAKVTNSKFQNNLLAISNSLAIVGSPVTVLEDNTFQDNGGTTAEIIQYSLNNSYFLTNRARQAEIYNNNHFGQSTSVYLDRSFQIDIIRNTFKGNWGPWEGSQVLASSLTIKNLVAVRPGSLSLKDSKFIDHQGIPADITRVLSNNALKNNSYMPPIITISFDEYLQSQVLSLLRKSPGGPSIVFENSRFDNNILSFNLTEGCKYNANEITKLCALMKSKRRYLTGIIKFLNPFEVLDYITNDIFYSSLVEIGALMNNVQITNNNLLTEGCLFSTLSIRRYFLNNILIQNNQINLLGENFTEMALSNSPFLSIVMNRRDGIFCAFNRESFSITAFSNIIADTLEIKNNTGTIFNLYPSESSSLFLRNSLIINNTCVHGSIIESFDNATILPFNNLFIQNNNSLGFFFITDSSYISFYNTYLQNEGKHASLAFLNDNTQAIEAYVIAYWNYVNPKFLMFMNNLTPQGGLYFSLAAQITVIKSYFAENKAYAGIFTSVRSISLFNGLNISNYHVSGFALVGSFMELSSLTMMNSSITNSSIQNESSQTRPSMIILMTSNLYINGLNITKIPSLNQGNLISGVYVNGAFANLYLQDVQIDRGESLINLDSSDISITNLNCSYISNLFMLSKTILTLKSMNISDLQRSGSGLSIIKMFSSTLRISQLKYKGDTDSGDYSSLITGTNNYLEMVEAHFINAVIGQSMILDLQKDSLVFVANSVFEYNVNYVQTILFSFRSSLAVHIQNCVFILPGQIVQAEGIASVLQFVSNIIITNSHISSVEILGSNNIYFANNYISRQGNSNRKDFSESQLHFEDNLGKTILKHNIIQCLYGSIGVIEIKSSIQSYNLESKNNIYTHNVGSKGGVFYLDAAQYSTANIEESLFVSNNAITLQSNPGKGGAIFLTTSAQANQITSIINCIFLNNYAESSGGAIYFDYMPPEIDTNSVFKRNEASTQLNHISSYATRLVYYGEKLPETDIYLPNPIISGEQPPKREYSSPIHRNYQTSPDEQMFHWNGIASGLYVPQAYYFAVLDMFGQVQFDDNSSSLQMYPQGLTERERSIFSSRTSVQANKGVYELTDIRFIYDIGASINIKFNSSAIQEGRIPLLEPSLPLSDSVTIAIEFRHCGQGEFINKVNATDTCAECPLGYWQTNPNPDAAYCEPCDSDSTICLGGNRVGPRKGYWRLNKTSDIMLRCPNPASCLGNEINTQDSSNNNVYINPTGECETTHQGYLCSNCILGWARTSDGKCTDCNADWWYYLRVLLFSLFQILLIVNSVRGVMSASDNRKRGEQKRLNAATLTRILTNYLQLVSIIAEIPIPWPNLIKGATFGTSEASAIGENILTLDCFFSSENVYAIKIVFLKLLFETTLAVVLSIIAATVWTLYFLIKKRIIFRRKELANKIMTTMIIICFIMQPRAIKASFSFFKCLNLYRNDQPEYYFSKDYDVQCWTGSHLNWALGFGLPSLIIWSIILPFTIFNILKKNKTRLEAEDVSQKYSFLYGGYRPSRYFWEFIIMMRKLLFISLTLSASFHSTGLEVYVSVILIILSYILQIFSQPYAESELNSLENLSLIGAGCVTFCGLYFQLVSRRKEILDIIVIVCCLIGNLVFLVMFVKVYLMARIKQIKTLKLQVTSTVLRWFKSLKSKSEPATPATPQSPHMMLSSDEMIALESKSPRDTNLMSGYLSPISKSTTMPHFAKRLFSQPLSRSHSIVDPMSLSPERECDEKRGFSLQAIEIEDEERTIPIEGEPRKDNRLFETYEGIATEALNLMTLSGKNLITLQEDKQ